MNIGKIPIPISDEFYRRMAMALPNVCTCRKCGFQLKVNPAHCLWRGWPKCCGETMELGPMRKPLSWKCHVCGEERPDEKISVHTRDISAEYGVGFPAGTIQENVRYCNDRPKCIAGAKTKRLIPTTITI